MKKHTTMLFLTVIALLALLPACQTAPEAAILTVGDGTTTASYTAAELRELPAVEASANGETYVGVPLAALLEDAGFDPGAASAVTAVAADDFSATYTAEQVNRPDTLVAYARRNGTLAGDEQPFRMVLPDERGRLNVRMLSRIEVSS